MQCTFIPLPSGEGTDPKQALKSDFFYPRTLGNLTSVLLQVNSLLYCS